ncbi:MAG: DUF465 domain-containing protein [Candidatus Pacebacteria bacterium]|nr:DUF465 domain-containing protein [Candidatus Paceibacterota bacterium]MBP9843082.1 DUF465 domain-containing protein [Candidatus Paceibacterota bacterium]
MNKGSKESIQKQIRHYTAKHQSLAEDLAAEERRRIQNATQIRRIKKLKLMCKDKLTELRKQLTIRQNPSRFSAEVIPLPLPPLVTTDVLPRRVASG